LTLLENGGNVRISDAEGDVIRVIVTGYNNTIGKNFTINKQVLERMSSEYAQSLTKFIEGFKKYDISPEQATETKNAFYGFTWRLKA
jgi:ribosomal protein S17E